MISTEIGRVEFPFLSAEEGNVLFVCWKRVTTNRSQYQPMVVAEERGIGVVTRCTNGTDDRVNSKAIALDVSLNSVLQYAVCHGGKAGTELGQVHLSLRVTTTDHFY